VKRSSLPGGYGWLASLYRSFRGILTPSQIDACELWQLAVLADGDIADAPTLEEQSLGARERLLARQAQIAREVQGDG